MERRKVFRTNASLEAEKAAEKTLTAAVSKDRAPVTKPQRKPVDSAYENELAQLRVRYPNDFTSNDLGIRLSVPITDPEFPFDLESVRCDLRYVESVWQIRLVDCLDQQTRNYVDDQLAILLKADPSPRNALKKLDVNLETWICNAQSGIKLFKPTEIKISKEQASVSEFDKEVAVSKPETPSTLSTDDTASQYVRIEPLDQKLLPVTHQLFLPELQLSNVSVLSVTQISLLVCCSRCQSTNNLKLIRPHSSLFANCRKCSRRLEAAFHPDLTHTSNNRLCAIKTATCTPTDIVEATLQVSCESCSGAAEVFRSTAHPSMKPGDQRFHSTCPSCHKVMSGTFKVPLAWRSPALTNKLRAPPKQAPITPGQPLPENGACDHFKKSFRWYRYACCGRAYACDDCHDKKVVEEGLEKHELQHGSRYICGFCAHEQPVSRVECEQCGESKVPRFTSHWEGGKGMRDQTRMSRKDAKKYSGLSKS